MNPILRFLAVVALLIGSAAMLAVVVWANEVIHRERKNRDG